LTFASLFRYSRGGGLPDNAKLAKCQIVRNRKAGTLGAHPSKDIYASGAVEGGAVEMWRFGSTHGPVCADSIGDVAQRVTRVRFNALGKRKLTFLSSKLTFLSSVPGSAQAPSWVLPTVAAPSVYSPR
jgi:hypothetical protein